jgi:hypothetical protein
LVSGKEHLQEWIANNPSCLNENAEELLQEFLETEDYREKLNVGNSQRIMMVAGEFRKEVTSSVLWLLNYGLRIQCFKVIPYKLANSFF